MAHRNKERTGNDASPFNKFHKEKLLSLVAAVSGGTVAAFAAFLLALCLLLAVSALFLCTFLFAALILAAFILAALGLLTAASICALCLLIVVAA